MTEEGPRAEEVLDIEFLHEIGSRMAAAIRFMPCSNGWLISFRRW